MERRSQSPIRIFVRETSPSRSKSIYHARTNSRSQKGGSQKRLARLSPSKRLETCVSGQELIICQIGLPNRADLGEKNSLIDPEHGNRESKKKAGSAVLQNSSFSGERRDGNTEHIIFAKTSPCGEIQHVFRNVIVKITEIFSEEVQVPIISEPSSLSNIMTDIIRPLICLQATCRC